MNENLQAQLEQARRKVAQLEELRAMDAHTHRATNGSIALLEGQLAVARSKAASADKLRQEAHETLDAAGVRSGGLTGGLVDRIGLLAGERTYWKLLAEAKAEDRRDDFDEKLRGVFASALIEQGVDPTDPETAKLLSEMCREDLEQMRREYAARQATEDGS